MHFSIILFQKSNLGLTARIFTVHIFSAPSPFFHQFYIVSCVPCFWSGITSHLLDMKWRATQVHRDLSAWRCCFRHLQQFHNNFFFFFCFEKASCAIGFWSYYWLGCVAPECVVLSTIPLCPQTPWAHVLTAENYCLHWESSVVGSTFLQLHCFFPLPWFTFRQMFIL